MQPTYLEGVEDEDANEEGVGGRGRRRWERGKGKKSFFKNDFQ